MTATKGQWFGVVGKRYRLKLRVVRTYTVKTNRGRGFCYLFYLRDEKGNIYKAFHSASFAFPENVWFSVAATVKEHSVEKGFKVTVLQYLRNGYRA